MFRLATCVVVLLSTLQYAHAGRPIETDDASVADFRTCQIDFWTEGSRDLRQDNFNGGCNFFGSSELSLGLGKVSGDAEDQSLKSVGYKHIVQTFSDTTPGFGLAVSREWGRMNANSESSQESLATVIASVPLAGEDLLLHLNLGYLQFSDQAMKDESLYRAAALDYSFNERVGFSIETYSGVQESLSWRVGARYTLIPDFLQVDASYGSDYGNFQSARVFTIGLGFTPSF